MNVKHVTADTASAVGLTIEQGTAHEMRIQDQQIGGVINPTQGHEVVNKVYADGQKVLMKNSVDEKHREQLCLIQQVTLKQMIKYMEWQLPTQFETILTAI